MTVKSPTADSEVPQGFVPLFRTSPFQDTLGPLFYRRTKASFVVGLRIASKHTKSRGNAPWRLAFDTRGYRAWIYR
jgi:hypothetical protein